MPYWPLYLKELGQTPELIGILTALALGIRVLGPPLWGGIADRGARNRVITTTSLMAGVVFALFFFGTGFYWILAVTAGYSLFHAGPLALVEATTLEAVARQGWDYGRIRLWGSVGFILASFGMGLVTDHLGIRAILPAMLFFLFAGALLTLALPASEKPSHAQVVGDGHQSLFSRPAVRWFYLAGLCMQFSHGAYYGFMSIHLEHHGYSRTAIGLLWALGVVAEVVVLANSNRLVTRFGIATLLTWSLLVAAGRWSLFAMTLWLPLLLLGQTLHAFTFGTFHVAAVRRAFTMASLAERGTAQSWYSGIAYGIGGGLGLVISGRLFGAWGGEPLFALMAVVAGLGVVAAWRSNRLFKVENNPSLH